MVWSTCLTLQVVPNGIGIARLLYGHSMTVILTRAQVTGKVFTATVMQQFAMLLD